MILERFVLVSNGLIILHESHMIKPGNQCK